MFFENNVKIKKGVVGIYYLFKDNEIVYVGQSIDIYHRVAQHLRSKIFDSWNFISVNKELLNDMETNEIIKYNPIYNENLPPNNLWRTLNYVCKSNNIGRRDFKKIIHSKKIAQLVFKGETYYNYRQTKEVI